jgi:hypothetical protein
MAGTVVNLVGGRRMLYGIYAAYEYEQRYGRNLSADVAELVRDLQAMEQNLGPTADVIDALAVTPKMSTFVRIALIGILCATVDRDEEFTDTERSIAKWLGDAVAKDPAVFAEILKHCTGSLFGGGAKADETAKKKTGTNRTPPKPKAKR